MYHSKRVNKSIALDPRALAFAADMGIHLGATLEVLFLRYLKAHGFSDASVLGRPKLPIYKPYRQPPVYYAKKPD